MEPGGPRVISNNRKTVAPSGKLLVNKLKRLGTSRRVRDGYTMRDLELCLGEDHHKIAEWTKTDGFRTAFKGTRRHNGNGNDIHRIREQDILDFIRNHPQEINLGRVDQTWFLDLVLLEGREMREATLSKEANLMRTAVRSKVDAPKIIAGVTSELSAKGRRGKSTEGDCLRKRAISEGHQIARKRILFSVQFAGFHTDLGDHADLADVLLNHVMAYSYAELEDLRGFAEFLHASVLSRKYVNIVAGL